MMRALEKNTGSPKTSNCSAYNECRQNRRGAANHRPNLETCNCEQEDQLDVEMGVELADK